MFRRLRVALSPVVAAGTFWENVHHNVGGDEGLKNLVLSEHTGMGVVAALVLTIAAAGFLVSPSSYKPENLHNEAMDFLLTGSLSIAFICAIYSIAGSWQIAALTLFIPVTDMLPWVQRFKGKPHHEYFGIVMVALLALAVACGALVYLMKGGLHATMVGCMIGGVGVIYAITHAWLGIGVCTDFVFRQSPVEDARTASGTTPGAQEPGSAPHSNRAGAAATAKKAVDGGLDEKTPGGATEGEGHGASCVVRSSAKVHPL